MSVLLSQLYISKPPVKQRRSWYSPEVLQEAAALHENILRAFTDSTSKELEGSMESSLNGSVNGNSSMFDLQYNHPSVSQGEHVRTHLKLVKLAIERIGAWPKDYSEYERLNNDILREFRRI
jgi:hypothetical protein